MGSLSDKLLKAVQNNAYAAIMSDSKLLKEKATDMSSTGIPMLDVALSGKFHGGLMSGITILAGPSKMGKSYIGLVMINGYLNNHKDSMCVFFDTEFGSNVNYFEKLNIDMSRIIHIPVQNIEDLKFQSVKIMEELDNNDKVVFYLDSLGNLASLKEIEDAQNEKSVADMSRAKAIKSYFRIIAPYVNLKQIPFIAINHTYDSIGFIPQTTMGGGTGPLYNADTVLFLSKAQEKDGTDLLGFDFKLKVHKSRYVKENSVFCLNSTFENGIDIYSDLFEFAIKTGYITKPKNGWYQKAEKYNDEKMYRQKEISRNTSFWKDFIDDIEFVTAYENHYKL